MFMKKVLAVVLTIAMLVSMSVFAFADEDNSIVVNNKATEVSIERICFTSDKSFEEKYVLQEAEPDFALRQNSDGWRTLEIEDEDANYMAIKGKIVDHDDGVVAYGFTNGEGVDLASWDPKAVTKDAFEFEWYVPLKWGQDGHHDIYVRLWQKLDDDSTEKLLHVDLRYSGEREVDEDVDPFTSIAPAATEAPKATEAPTATEEANVTEVPTATEEVKATEAPAEATEAPKATEEAKATEAPKATDAPAEKKGCGSIVTGSAVVLLAVAAVSLKKKEN